MLISDKKSQTRLSSQYPLPFIVYSKLNYQIRGCFFFLFFLIIFALFLPLFSYIFPSGSVRVLRLPPLSEVCILLFLAAGILSSWMYLDVFHRAYIYGDVYGLRLKLFMQREKMIPWEQIGLIDFMQAQRVGRYSFKLVHAAAGKGTHIRIILRDTDPPRNPLRRFPKTYYIPLASFVTLDCYRFLNTVGEQMEIASKK